MSGQKSPINALGKLIQSEREAQGLSRRELVELAGYRNVSKGANKLDTLERGEPAFPHRQLLLNFARPLGIDEARLEAAMRADFAALDVPHPPQLLERLVSFICRRIPGTETMSREEAEAFAAEYSARVGRSVCLVLSPVRCVYFYPNGGRSESFRVPDGTLGNLVCGG